MTQANDVQAQAQSDEMAAVPFFPEEHSEGDNHVAYSERLQKLLKNPIGRVNQSNSGPRKPPQPPLLLLVTPSLTEKDNEGQPLLYATPLNGPKGIKGGTFVVENSDKNRENKLLYAANVGKELLGTSLSSEFMPTITRQKVFTEKNVLPSFLLYAPSVTTLQDQPNKLFLGIRPQYGGIMVPGGHPLSEDELVKLNVRSGSFVPTGAENKRAYVFVPQQNNSNREFLNTFYTVWDEDQKPFVGTSGEVVSQLEAYINAKAAQPQTEFDKLSMPYYQVQIRVPASIEQIGPDGQSEPEVICSFVYNPLKITKNEDNTTTRELVTDPTQILTDIYAKVWDASGADKLPQGEKDELIRFMQESMILSILPSASVQQTLKSFTLSNGTTVEQRPLAPMDCPKGCSVIRNTAYGNLPTDEEYIQFPLAAVRDESGEKENAHCTRMRAYLAAMEDADTDDTSRMAISLPTLFTARYYAKKDKEGNPTSEYGIAVSNVFPAADNLGVNSSTIQLRGMHGSEDMSHGYMPLKELNLQTVMRIHTENIESQLADTQISAPVATAAPRAATSLIP